MPSWAAEGGTASRHGRRVMRGGLDKLRQEEAAIGFVAGLK
jgi:hypothetical protein